MSTNLIAIPLKQTQQVSSLASSIINHIDTTSNSVHPDEISRDAQLLQQLRDRCLPLPPLLDQSTVINLSAYHAQLTQLITKIPLDIGLTFPWYPLFSTPSSSSLSLVGSFLTSTPITLSNLSYERLCVLYSLATVYSTLAIQGSRTDEEGMKRAIAHFQDAAGTLSHLLVHLPPPPPLSPDLTTATLESLRDLCLAQAQEVFWQKGVMGRLKNGTIAKLAAQVSEYYASAEQSANKVRLAAGDDWPNFGFPDSITNYLLIKKLHFGAVAQYRKSVDDLGANRYGDELGRLEVADGLVKKALAVPKRGVAEAVLRDLKPLQSIITDNRTRAQKDNTLIYLEPTTTPSSLPPIVPAPMTRSTTPPSIIAPLNWLHTGAGGLGKPLFEALVPVEVGLAVSVYEDRKNELIKTELGSRVEELDRVATSTLHSLNLPASIDAVLQPIGLPPSLVDKSREIKSEGGVERLRTMMSDVRRVGKVNQKLLNEALAALTQEETYDTNLRTQHGTDRWTRPASHLANQELVHRAENLSGVMRAAGESDGLVRGKFAEWEDVFGVLSGDEATLNASIPQLSTSSISPLVSSSTPISPQTLVLRTLRRHLDDLTTLRTTRQQLLLEAKRAVVQDDCRALFVREIVRRSNTAAAGGVGGGAASGAGDGQGRRVELSELEEVFETQLSKFKGFKEGVKKNAGQQEDLLGEIKTANSQFIHHRRTDPALAQREAALQRLDEGYLKYREVLTNLQEGLKFYSDLSRLLTELREGCRLFKAAREQEASDLLQHLSLQRGVGGMRIAEQEKEEEQPTASPARNGNGSGGGWKPGDGIRFG